MYFVNINQYGYNAIRNSNEYSFVYFEVKQQMKLTTIKQQNPTKGINNVFRLKKLIQTAANDTNQETQYRLNDVLCNNSINTPNMPTLHCNIDTKKNLSIQQAKNNNRKPTRYRQKQNLQNYKSQDKFRKKSNKRNLVNSITVVCLERSISKSISERCQLYKKQNNSNFMNIVNSIHGKSPSCIDGINQPLKSHEYHKSCHNVKSVSKATRPIKIIDAPIMPQKLKKSQSTHQLFREKFKSLKNNAHVLSQAEILKSKTNNTPRQGQNLNNIHIKMFKIGKKLGRGRFGNVFMAEHRQTGFICAIKIVNKQQLQSSKMQQQLLSQIKLQTYMNHPNILKMHSFFHDQKNIYLMLQIGQQCLFKQLRKKIVLHEKQTAYYFKQIIEGFKYLHSEKIIHRDLKPENIMLVNDVVKIGDFGWSVYSPMYKRNTFCGTLDYVPPEIVKGDFYDESVDIWSLGILIYELSIGKAPFQGDCSEDETFGKIKQAKFEIPERVSSQLRTLIQKILHKDPVNRVNLSQIQNSQWLKSYDKEGRCILPQIWNFWQDLS